MQAEKSSTEVEACCLATPHTESMPPVKSTIGSAWMCHSCQFSPFGSPPRLLLLQIYPETWMFSSTKGNVANNLPTIAYTYVLVSV